MKRQKPLGRSSRYGRKPAPYTRYDKRPYTYSFQTREGVHRLANGELRYKANDRDANKYNTNKAG